MYVVVMHVAYNNGIQICFLFFLEIAQSLPFLCPVSKVGKIVHISSVFKVAEFDQRRLIHIHELRAVGLQQDAHIGQQKCEV